MFGKGRPASKTGPFKGPTAAEEPTAPKSPFTQRKGKWVDNWTYTVTHMLQKLRCDIVKPRYSAPAHNDPLRIEHTNFNFKKYFYNYVHISSKKTLV